MFNMKRRDFIAFLGGVVAAWPLAARAQQQARVFRIGFLGFGAASTWSNRVKALRGGLRDLGYAEGKNIVIEFRWTETTEQLRELATELVRMNVDLIFAPSSTEVEVARQVTNAIPIVFATHADPGRPRARRKPVAAGREHHGLVWFGCRPRGQSTGNIERGRPLRHTLRRLLDSLSAVAPFFLASRERCRRQPRRSSAYGTRANRRGFGPSVCDGCARTRRRYLCPTDVAQPLLSRSTGRTGTEAPVAQHVRREGVCRGGWSHQLRNRL